jgi:hypothetical protein
VALTSALAQALGLAGSISSFGIIEGAPSNNGFTCTLGSANCYNGFITVTNSANTFYYRSLSGGSQPAGTFDFFTAVEHETDEVLGTPSCIVGVGMTSGGCTNGLSGNPSAAVAAADLFRYTNPTGTRSYSSNANGQLAYFSIDNGVTNIASYNNTPNGADYGDWDSALNRVQNAFGTPSTNGVDISNDGGSEIAVLDAIGYNLVTASTIPEPGTLTLLGVGLLLLGAFKMRRPT